MAQAQEVNVEAVANEVIMPEKTCSICSDNYTAIIRKRVTCKYCKKDICSKCIEQYLLTRSDDAHCIHCRVHYNDKDLNEICTKTYLKDRYFKHRQEILVNRERANLPGLQQEAHREKQRRERSQIVIRITQEIKDLIDVRNGVRSEFIRLSVLNEKKYESELKKITKEMDEYMETIRLKKQQLFELRFNHEEKVEEKKEEPKKFIRRCMKSNCNGFLSTAWKCGLCEWYSCSKCFTVKGEKHDSHHECKEDDLKTAELIRADSKPCPNCGEFINKSSGCFAPNTPILLWDGTIKMSQDINTGDELIGDDGKKRTVLGLVSGEDTMYEVTQNNGMTYVVNSKHKLLLKYSGDRSISWIDSDKQWQIKWFDTDEMTGKTKKMNATDETKDEVLQQMEEFKSTLKPLDAIEILVETYMELSEHVKKQLCGFKCEGIDWPKQDVPLDPYMLGLYLGDGINDGMSFAINAEADPEILYTNKVEVPRKNPLCDILKQYGMVGSLKRIPLEYIVNDRETRLQVLAGIIDTDGHIAKMNEGRRVSITSSKELFAQQIFFLARSLGYATTINRQSKKGIAFSKGGEKKDYDDHFIINISGHISEIPTRIVRKKCVDSNPNKDMLRTSISVKNIGEGEYFGWSVDSNKRFLLGDTTCAKNCDQMYCVSCQTPFSWTTLKIVTSGAIHNPHYYEMMKRKGQLPRNPGDVPCGGFPTRYQLVIFPRKIDPIIADYFYEFHRICEEVQHVSHHQFRAHVDNATTHPINIQFLLGDFNEAKWGQKLAINEKKRKRDAEVQEVFAAFLMVAVNIVNTVQNYRDDIHESFRNLPAVAAEQILLDLHVEIRELFIIINDAFKEISLSYSYTVPYIDISQDPRDKNAMVYRLQLKNFKDKKRSVVSAAFATLTAANAANAADAANAANAADAADADEDE